MTVFLGRSAARPAFRWTGFARVTSLLLALIASPAFACAVCGAGEDDPSRTSYIGMTIIISLLPLGMLGGIVGYVFMKSREPAPAEPDRAEP